jgi:hypothetical protein
MPRSVGADIFGDSGSARVATPGGPRGYSTSSAVGKPIGWACTRSFPRGGSPAARSPRQPGCTDGATIQLEMKGVLAALIFVVVMTGLVGGYFFVALRRPIIAGGAFTGLAATCALLAAWQLLYAGPGNSHIVFGIASVLAAAGCLIIGISTLRNGGPGRRR